MKIERFEDGVVMSGDVFHVAALGEEIIDITKIGISDNY
jgi:DNA repair exonuclease SbcCD nuclease subunit